ncbi:hypothetical protein FRC03_001913 [Tulasnella sp. 419]|nr:hypothetical protein FRC03_001913 [Tulasnella sp. 419]
MSEANDALALTEMLDSEKAWVKRYQFLEDNGYRLRPRYRPDWTPSWVKDGVEDAKARFRAEDAISLWRATILDAQRVKDGKIVVLKYTKADSPEIEIGKFVSSSKLRDDPANHCMPLLDVLVDPTDPNHAILVLPLLRHIEIPMPVTVSECVDFMQQTLEGLSFLHQHKIAHRDCAVPNIMMDARRMFPSGWHPMDETRLYDGRTNLASAQTRTAAGGVRYYYVDFGLSTKDEESVLGEHGQERAPELEKGQTVPYDPFALDVYILGMSFKRHILLQTRGAEAFVQPLVESMTVEKPDDRPTADECIKMLQDLVDKPSHSRKLRHRLRSYQPEKENVIMTFVLDAKNYLINRRAKPIEGPKEVDPLDPLYDGP